MCTVCGCAEGEVRIEGDHHHHDDAAVHNHAHQQHNHAEAEVQAPAVNAEGDIHFGQGPARAHVPGLSQSRMVQIEQDILGKNDRYAAINRARFEAGSIFTLNLVSSPGSGKTTLLTETLHRISQKRRCAVIEGDQQTANDADRIRETGVRAIQVNTGKGCHLDAHMVGHAAEHLDELEGGLLFIENVGNLVCPAAFDLGEAHKVAILSVTEGEDKPLKYPDMFFAADLMILNKVDLLPYLDFDTEQCIAYARQVNPQIQVLQLSARSGEGMEQWIDWLEAKRGRLLQCRIDQLNQQIQQLQALL
ncbi:hydrogenase nickel incorporation protein HypB [Marinobacterium jannaschii]|uniref:hydrogenase nickel incorporation protein HypB n=1 Tax=Marinobacterium jannaschii TaxID=64970 RepID=UPI000488AB0D|nr:hydrogenase nickel incorporation protein HypB [Marinobacterium jannaschii]